MKNSEKNKSIIMILLVINGFLQSCSENNEQSQMVIYACYVPEKVKETSYMIVLRKYLSDSLHFNEKTILVNSSNNFNLNYDKSSFHIIKGGLYKTYLDNKNNKRDFPFLLLKSQVNSDSFFGQISEKAINFHINERFEKRVFVKNMSMDNQSLNIFLTKNSNTDGLEYYSYYDKNYILNKKVFTKGYSKYSLIQKIDTIPKMISRKF